QAAHVVLDLTFTGRVSVESKTREVPQAGPALARLAGAHEHVASASDENSRFMHRDDLGLTLRRWDYVLQLLGVRRAKRLQGTLLAVGIARRADLAAQFHQGLIESSRAFNREQFRGKLPETALCRNGMRIVLQRQEPAIQTVRVGFQNRL